MDVSKITKSNNGKYFTLRTIVPKNIYDKLKLSKGDFLVWLKTDNDKEVLVKKQND